MKTDPLLRIVLFWTALVSGVLVWLPLTRGSTQGDPYRWELAPGIGGSGVGGDYWMLVFAALFVFTMLWLGWRGAPQPFHWLLLAFHVPLAAAVMFAAVKDPESLRFEGATAGVDIPLAVIGPVLFCGFAFAAIVWVARDLRSGTRRQRRPWVWTRAARIRLILVLALIPLEVVLFHAGGIESPQNVAGIFCVGWQWMMVNLLFATAPPQTKPPAARSVATG